jgi:threonine efflux protein
VYIVEAYAAALILTVAAQAAPGPNLVAVAAAALGQGRRAAVYVTLGVASGVLVWVTAVAFGLAVLLDLFPAVLTAMKILGGCYLLYVAAKAARSVLWPSSGGTIRAAGQKASDFRNWRFGLFVVLSNPKAGLMWIAVASFLFGQGLEAPTVLAFGPLGAVSAFLVYGAYALLFSTGRITLAYQKFQRGFEAAFAAAFGAMGAALILSGLREAHR